MKLKFYKSTLSAIFALSTIAAYAGDYCAPQKSSDPGFYIFAYGGVSFSDDFNSNITNIADIEAAVGFPVTDQETFNRDTGFIVGGGAGVRSNFFGGSRLEIEGLYQESDVGSIISGANTFTDPDLVANISSTAVMVNFLKEIPLGCVTGYIGGGIGVANIESEIDFFGESLTDNNSAFAHQFIVGADLPLGDQLSIFLQYKLYDAGTTEVNGPSGIPGLPGRNEFDTGYQSNLVMGARIHF